VLVLSVNVRQRASVADAIVTQLVTHETRLGEPAAKPRAAPAGAGCWLTGLGHVVVVGTPSKRKGATLAPWPTALLAWPMQVA
jgi:hypothetical protein